jgi:DNA-binding transcriptional LysR family regulator
MKHFDDPKRRPKTSELEVIVAIATSGSFGGAAAQLGCTQSRISHALGEVESVVGTRLFQRSRTGTFPTEVGVVAVARAREILQLIDRLTAGRPGSGLMGVVRIAAYRSIATHLLTPAVPEITFKHRGLRIEIDDSCAERADVERQVHDGRADLGIAHMPIGAGFATKPFVQDDYMAVIRSDGKPSKGAFWRDLASLPLFELRCSGARAAVEACRRNGMTNRTAATFSSDSTILAQVAVRRGIAILPRLAVEPLPARMVALPLPIPALRSLAILRRRGRPSPAARAVADTLLTAIRQPTFPARKWLHTAPSWNG